MIAWLNRLFRQKTPKLVIEDWVKKEVCPPCKNCGGPLILSYGGLPKHALTDSQFCQVLDKLNSPFAEWSQPDVRQDVSARQSSREDDRGLLNLQDRDQHGTGSGQDQG